MPKVWKKSWEPFGSCLLNSTANPAKLGWKWAGLAVLFSRHLPNGSHDFFQTFSISFLIISLKTHKPQSPSHFWHIISQLQVVWWVTRMNKLSGVKMGDMKCNFCNYYLMWYFFAKHLVWIKNLLFHKIWVTWMNEILGSDWKIYEQT